MPISNTKNMALQMRNCPALADWQSATELRVLPTVGDGSCALHAAEGTWLDREHSVVAPKVDRIRSDFAQSFEAAIATPSQPEDVAIAAAYRGIVMELLTSTTLRQNLTGDFLHRCEQLRAEAQSHVWQTEQITTLKQRTKKWLESDEMRLGLLASLDSGIEIHKWEEQFDKVAQTLLDYGAELNIPDDLRGKLESYLKNAKELKEVENKFFWDDVVGEYAVQLAEPTYYLSPAELGIYARLKRRACLVFSTSTDGKSLSLEMAVEGQGPVMAVAHNGHLHYEQVVLATSGHHFSQTKSLSDG